jgi:hypothetical protein
VSGGVTRATEDLHRLALKDGRRIVALAHAHPRGKPHMHVDPVLAAIMARPHLVE